METYKRNCSLELINDRWSFSNRVFDGQTDLPEYLKELQIRNTNLISDKYTLLPHFIKSNNSLTTIYLVNVKLPSFEYSSKLETLEINDSIIDNLVISKTLKFIRINSCVIKSISFEEGPKHFYIRNSSIENTLLNLPESLSFINIDNTKTNVIINSKHLEYLYLQKLDKSYKLELDKLKKIDSIVLRYVRRSKIDLSNITIDKLNIEFSNLTLFKLPRLKKLVLNGSYITPQPIFSEYFEYHTCNLKEITLHNVQRIKIYVNLKNTKIYFKNPELITTAFLFHINDTDPIKNMIGKTSITWFNNF